jgi:exodeoxyribonuclease V alpha subunit
MNEPRLTSAEEIIEARVNRVTYRSPQGHFAILGMDRTDRREAITAIGPLADYHKGDRLSLVGRFETHGKYGLQFRVSFANSIPPQDQEGIREYLINAKIRGIGARRVDQLIELFGDETLEVITEHPERLKEVEGLGKTRIDRLCEVVVLQKSRQET